MKFKKLYSKYFIFIGKTMKLSSIRFSKQLESLVRYSYNRERFEKIKSMLGEHGRDLEMVKMFVKGQTLTDIGNEYGISRERVRQIMIRVKENENRIIGKN